MAEMLPSTTLGGNFLPKSYRRNSTTFSMGKRSVMRVRAPTMGVLGMGRLMVSVAMRVAAMVKRRPPLRP